MTILFAPALAATGDRTGFDAQTALARSQGAIGVRLDDHRFVDTRGRNVRLGDLGGKPLVLSLVYTSCPGYLQHRHPQSRAGGAGGAAGVGGDELLGRHRRLRFRASTPPSRCACTRIGKA